VARNTVRGANGRYERRLEHAELDAQACKMRASGATYAEIAAALDLCDVTAAWRAVGRALAATVAEPAAEVRQLELARLDEATAAAFAVLRKDHLAHSHGKVITLDGKPVLDDGPKLAAIDRIVKISERRAKLLGLDAPTQVQVITVDLIDAEIARLAAELGLSAGDAAPGQVAAAAGAPPAQG
jgi:hypothetical protein